MKKVYISGKITGASPEELDLFRMASQRLEQHGEQPIAPIKNGIPTNGLPYDAPWIEHIIKDLRILNECDAIIFLPNYQKSKGAMVELYTAQALGKEIRFGSIEDYPPFLRLQRIIEETIGILDLKDKSQKQEFVAARTIMAAYCKARLLSHKQTSPYVGRAPGTIANMYKDHYNFSKTWPQYRRWWMEVRQKMEQFELTGTND